MSTFFNLINDNLLNGGAYKDIIKALTVTVEITVIAWIVAIAFGGLVSYFMCYEKKLVSRLSEAVCFIFRGIPALLAILIFYYGFFGRAGVSGVLIFGTAIGLYGAGHFAEIIARFVNGERRKFSGRADKRMEKSFYTLMLPEAVEENLYHIKRLFIILMQWTVVAGYVEVNDLTEVMTEIGHRNMYPFFAICFTAICFLVATALVELLFKFIDKKLKKAAESSEEK